MTNEEIAKLFEVAPEGATHYNPRATALALWYRRIQDGWEYWQPDLLAWEKSANDGSFFANLMAAPQWSGEGLPPVGTVCEGLDGCNRWHRCRIVHHSIGEPQRALAATGDDEAGLGIFHAFRPIRTPEQIAAEEREKAIEDIVQVLDSLCLRKPVAAAEAIYAAGYRKPKPGAQ